MGKLKWKKYFWSIHSTSYRLEIFFVICKSLKCITLPLWKLTLTFPTFCLPESCLMTCSLVEHLFTHPDTTLVSLILWVSNTYLKKRKKKEWLVGRTDGWQMNSWEKWYEWKRWKIIREYSHTMSHSSKHEVHLNEVWQQY